MLRISKPAADRVDIEVTGAIDADEMREGLRQLFDQSADVTHGRMLYTIDDFSLPTFGALAVEMQYLPELFRLLGRFDRCAVVSGTAWLRTAAEVEGALFPGIEIRSFEPGERDRAEAWLAEG